MHYQYHAVERALAHMFEVVDEEMPAFRARVRHLRNIGIPRLPKPGSGKKIAYTMAHALELFVALRLEQLGVAPTPIADMLKYLSNSGQENSKFLIFGGTDFGGYVELIKAKDGAELLSHIEDSNAAVILNITHIVTRLGTSLERASLQT